MMISSWTAFIIEHTTLLMVISIISLLAGLVLLPVFITRIPVDYFCHPRRHRLSIESSRPYSRLLVSGMKNFLGIILVWAGFLLLFLPGQGLVMILTGLMIMNYPGKFKLERWLIQRPYVLPSVNWLRKKYKHPPLRLPQAKEDK